MSTSTSTSPSPTLSPSFKALLDSFRSNLPVRFQQESWYIIAAASLVALNKPSEIGLLFTYIRQEQKSESKEELRQVLVRLRDVLMKGWVLVGIPVVVTAVAALAGAEEGLGLWEGDGEGDGAEGEGEGKWSTTQITPALTARGTSWLQTLYKQNLSPIFETWGSHRQDFEWLQRNVIYGMYLSDHSVLSGMDTELVTLVSIMCQGQWAPTVWHLRGLRRLGVGEGDVEGMERAVEGLAVWAGRETGGWARVGDVGEV